MKVNNDPDPQQQILLELEAAAAEMDRGRVRREKAIFDAVAAGVPIRTIGMYAGLSHARIHQMVKERDGAD